MFDVIADYRNVLLTKNVSHPIAAVYALLNAVQHIGGNGEREVTVSELTHQINGYIMQLKKANSSSSSPSPQRGYYPSIAVLAGVEIFTRMISQYSAGNGRQSPVDYIVSSGGKLLQNLENQLPKLVQFAMPFITDMSVIITCGFSRSVMAVLERAASCIKKPRFTVYCCESRPSDLGAPMVMQLRSLGIQAHLITDSAVNFYISRMTMVLVGAEAIVENGGLITSVGTSQLAIMAHLHKVPFYCVAESSKFVRRFPLSQFDIYPEQTAQEDEDSEDENVIQDELKLGELHPVVDYTDPQYISFILTDLGVLTPGGVSDELIKSA